MDYNPLLPHGFNLLWGVGIIFYLAFVLFAIGVVIGLIILLARFLLVGTRAAQLYLSLNGPSAAEARSAADAAAATPAPTPAPASPAPAPAPAAAPDAPAPPVGAEQVVAEPAAAEPAVAEPGVAGPAAPVHAEDPTPPDVRSDDIVFSDDVIPPASNDDIPPAPPVRKPATRAPRKPKTPPTV